MITELGEVSGGVSGGKRGFLRLNSNVSLPLRFFEHNLLITFEPILGFLKANQGIARGNGN